MNIWKKITVGAAALSLAATPVMAEGTNLEYGFQMKAADSEVNLGYTLYEDADQNVMLSAELSVDENGTNISMKLDDLLRANSEHLYLNAGKVAGVIETLTGMEGLKGSLGEFGINGDWVEVPLPECNKIVVEGENVDPEAMSAPEISEEMQTDLLAVILPFTPEESDGKLVITVNDDKLIQAAGALDTVIADHQEEILGLSKGNTHAAVLQNIDIKPAIEGYIDAVAEGMILADPEMDKETAVENVNAVIDAFIEQMIAEAGAANAGTTQVTPEMLEQMNCQAAVEEALKDADVDGTITITEEGCSGTLTVTEGTETSEITFETQAIENGYMLRIHSGEETMTLSYTLTESEFSASVEIPEESVSMTLVADFEETDDAIAGSLSLVMNADGEEVVITGYLDANTAVEVDAIAMPEDAADGYEVVKNITAMLCTPAAAEEQPVQE